MGNSPLSCFRGKGEVKVILLSGDVVHFRRPVTASAVMKKYPRHLVLHCATASHGSGDRRKISVVKPQESLKVRQSYLVMPVQAASGNSTTFLDTWAFFALNASKSKADSRLRCVTNSKRTAQLKSWFNKLFHKMFWTSRCLRVGKDDASTPLLESDSDESPSTKRSSTESSFQSSFQDWAPSLERIPESPTHSPDPRSSYRSYQSLHFAKPES